MTNFADLTTIAVGGPIASFIEPTSRVGVAHIASADDTAQTHSFGVGILAGFANDDPRGRLGQGCAWSTYGDGREICEIGPDV